MSKVPSREEADLEAQKRILLLQQEKKELERKLQMFERERGENMNGGPIGSQQQHMPFMHHTSGEYGMPYIPFTPQAGFQYRPKYGASWPPQAPSPDFGSQYPYFSQYFSQSAYPQEPLQVIF